MTTLLDSTPEVAAAEPRPKRIWRRLVLAAAVLLVAGLVAATAWVLAYQPLESGMVGGVDAATVEVHDNSFGVEYRVIAPGPGETISMWVGLHNTGPFGVTIVQVGNPFNPSGVVDPRMSGEVTGAGRFEVTDYSSGGPVQVSAPFAMEAGAAYEGLLSFDVADCATTQGTAGSRSTVTTVPVTYRVLGISRTVDLEIGYAISLEARPSCPTP